MKRCGMVLLAIVLNASAADEHLEPTNALYLIDPDAAVREARMTEMHRGIPFRSLDPSFEVVVLPAFESPWFLTFEEIPSSGCTRGFVSSLDSRMSVKPVQTSSATACISSKLVSEASRVLSKMLLLTRHPNDSALMIDGDNFYFHAFVQGYGVLEGSAWSPEHGSATGLLVHLAKVMRSLVESPQEASALESEAHSVLRKLHRKVGAHEG